MTNTKHANFSPSSSGRWLTCTKSLTLPQKPYQSNKYADIGTMYHNISEKLLKGKNIDRIKMSYKIYEADKSGLENIVYPYVDYVKSIIANGKDVLSFYEQKVFLSEDCYGTVDALLFDKETKTLHIIDLKTGSGVFVSSNKNTQLEIYAIGGINFIRKKGFAVGKIFIHIFQPTIDNISHVEVFKSDLKTLRKKVLKVIDDVKNDNAVFAPSAENCRWCSVVDCPELSRLALEACKEDFKEEEKTFKKNKHLTLSEKMKMVGPLKAFIAKTEEQVFIALDVGEVVKGYTLKKSRGQRKFKDEKKVISYLRRFKFGVSDIFKKELLSVAQMEKVIKKKIRDVKNINIPKSIDPKKIDLSDYIEKKEGKLKIVEDDTLQKK